MNEKSAKHLEKELAGKSVGGWTIERLLGNGKSAAVFLGNQTGQLAAIKVFDPTFLGSGSKKSQMGRIDRELALRGHHHEHLVRIYDGGECPKTGFLYVVMEYISAKSLFASLALVPRDKIRPLVAQVASAARFLLEDFDTVHRDIKTDNIVADGKFEKATLLDLGVVKPLMDDGDGSDLSGDDFVGTTRYAPPEFLFGQAEISKEAFRAITFYQLGGVLYDLLTRQRLFGHLDRHKLDWAIEHVGPDFAGASGPEDLINLAKDCLIKDAASRLRYVTWERFQTEQMPSTRVAAALERITRRCTSANRAETIAEHANWQATVAAQLVTKDIHEALRKTWHENRSLPRIACYESLPKDGRCFLIAEIEPPNPNLPLHRVFLGISVTIEDYQSGACEIGYQGIISTKVISEELFEGEYSAVLHRGTVGEEMTARYVHELVVRAVDYCQQLAVAEELHRMPTGFLENE